jgi:hypothetical protein
MSDDKSKRDFRDRDRINPEEKYEVQYWSEKFGVSAEELKKAVKHAGPMVKNVEAALKK